MTPQIITVSEFLAIINETLTFAYPQVVVEGEVSSFKINQGKFAFFDLKDETGVLSCFMMARELKLPIEDGMKIRVAGSPKITKFSKFSLTVRAIELAGEGELRRAMQLLKQKLEKEGLFDPARKRPLPKFPTTIGLITSGTSAAYSDFIKILNARWSGVTIKLADVTVQGQTATDQITSALEYFNLSPEPVDVIALIRGGGSLEDLMAFSTEPVARAVAASRIPIIVGVGHEIDTSLADYAADVRAATPTDAARLIVPDRTEISARVTHLEHRAYVSLTQAITRRRTIIDQRLAALEHYLRLPQERVGELTNRLRHSLERLASRQAHNYQQVQHFEHRLKSAQINLLAGRLAQLAALARTLRSFDPQATLNRGYAIVRHHGKILREPGSTKTGDNLTIQLRAGDITAQITKP